LFLAVPFLYHKSANFGYGLAFQATFETVPAHFPHIDNFELFRYNLGMKGLVGKSWGFLP